MGIISQSLFRISKVDGEFFINYFYTGRRILRLISSGPSTSHIDLENKYAISS